MNYTPYTDLLILGGAGNSRGPISLLPGERDGIDPEATLSHPYVGFRSVLNSRRPR